MQVSDTVVIFITVLATLVAAVPSPVAGSEKFSVFNGEQSVVVESGASRTNTTNALQVMADGDVNCKSSALCATLTSCDDAYRKVVPSNTYSTFYDDGDTGTCSGWCGLFVSGDHCQVLGQDLMDAYKEIRDRGHCSQCERKQIASGCMIKIDRVSGC
ncbi:hypothetical protein FE257_001085 [Aspergillus nanangensis]|uniref:Uncharacterized protein n=1 Tax=Aspergillus nanangensis TaxID=2582783 RepID=A0AAD4CVR2_ASPNN|nr:hypothetical protein FE257_001085 [Aspergillus nanangensis]